MEAKIERVEVVHSGPELVALYAPLRTARSRRSCGQTKRSRFAGPFVDGASRTRTGDLLGAIQVKKVQLGYLQAVYRDGGLILGLFWVRLMPNLMPNPPFS